MRKEPDPSTIVFCVQDREMMTLGEFGRLFVCDKCGAYQYRYPKQKTLQEAIDEALGVKNARKS